MVVTANPLTVLLAQQSSEYSKVISQASLVVPDGVGIVWAIRRLHHVRVDRVAGIHLAESILEYVSKVMSSPSNNIPSPLVGEGGVRGECSVYLVGGAPGIAERASKNLLKKYPGLRIAGTTDGFQSDEEVAAIIRRVQPGVVLVGMGQPRQEVWLTRYLKETGASVGMGVGGALDVWAGRLRAAPAWIQRLGMEWFFRLVQQPSRIWRLRRLPVFVWRVLRESGKGNNLTE